mmetsp:Transcript_26303/g.51680  ORF Transcript_26303/g.51680 Transcript_26303/m.51680 type:complete len:358 (+) Transcript_26303:941-2014(+)
MSECVSDRALQALPVQRNVAIRAEDGGAHRGATEPVARGAEPRRAEGSARQSDSSKAHADPRGGRRGSGGSAVVVRGEGVAVEGRESTPIHVHGGRVVGHLEGSLGSGVLGRGRVSRSGLLLLLAQASAPTTVTSVAASPTTMAAMAEASKASVQTAVTTPSNDAASVSVSSDTSATDTSATMRTTISGTTVTRASVPVALQLAGLLALLGGVLLNCLLSRGRGRGRGLSGVQTTSVPRASSSRAAETVSTGTAKCTSTNTSAAIGRGAVHRADVGGASVGGLVDSRVASLAAAVCIATETSTTHGRASRTSDSVSSEGVATDASRASHPPRSSPELPLRGCFKFCLGLCHRNLTRD